MHREYFLINDCCNWQAIEAVRESLPQLDIVPPLAFVVEAVYAVNRSAFVVSTQDEKILRVLDLVRKQQADSF